ncbi:ANTAR domain-containing protein [Streptomyces sp. R28]|uniref:ANTAR domain-containing protein n=1 Tax=Streptomyces sp. R28 TaxID=3238628 RepID=A0AB39PXC3_9ACTN
MSPAASGAHRRVATELLQAQRDGGPCLDSYGSGRPVPPVSIRAAREAARWPQFTERALAHGIADCAALGLRNNTTYAQSRALADQLQRALSSRVRIEQAKGMLAERWNTAADHAFVAMRQYARRHRLPLDRVADDAALRREAERADGEGRA